MKFLLLKLFILISLSVQAQSCCSGGVPVSSNLGFASENKGTFQMAFTTDFNLLSILKNGSEKLDDDLSERSTQSYILRCAYQLNNKWAFEVFLPYIRQSRRITSVSGIINQSTQGIGDPIFMASYNLINKAISVRTGLGIQFPLGSHTERNDNGLLFLEDMQPGSGALDLLPLLFVGWTPQNRPQGNLYLNTILTFNGTNQNSRNGLQTYQFGNDLQMILGYSESLILNNQIFNLGLSIRYRSALQDEVDNNELPGSGGTFLMGRLHAAWVISPQSQFSFMGEWPIYTKVRDTQLSPSRVINISFAHKFQKNNSEILQIK